MPVSTTECCGMMVLDGVRHFADAGPWSQREFFVELRDDLLDVDHTRYWHWPTVLIFTDAKRPGSKAKTAGDKFAEWIASQDLGQVTATSWRKNHNTDSNIKVWMWHPKTDACEALADNYQSQLYKRDGTERMEHYL